MRMKFQVPELYGLRLRFALRTIISFLACSLVFFLLYFSLDLLLYRVVQTTNFEQTRIQRQVENLQQYVLDHHLSSSDLSSLKRWEQRQPILFIEIYNGKELIYGSSYGLNFEIIAYEEMKGHGEGYALQLEDRPVTVYLFSDFLYQYYMIGTIVSVIVSFGLFLLLMLLGNRKLIRYICQLNDEVQILEGGNLEYEVSVEGNDEITDLARSMNRMRLSFISHMQAEQHLYESSRKLVGEMSHDLRTPLTGILLYLEVLKSHRYSSEEKFSEYLDKIQAKAILMKRLTDHLLEYSLKENSTKTKEPRRLQEIFESILSEFVSDLENRGFAVQTDVEWRDLLVDARSEYLERIFENIASNITKYAIPASNVVLETIYSYSYCGFSILNDCLDCAPSVESHGIGIESIQSLMQRMNGRCSIERTDTAFEINLLFPVL